jgi:hypothetical protein
MTARSKNSDFESAQENSLTHVTAVFGGEAPKSMDVVKSANARSKKRHEVGGSNFADIDVLPNSSKMDGNEMVGIKDAGYLVKKGTPFGVEAFFNSLPPGMDITDQELADIRVEPMKTYSGGLGFGDGWD